MELTAEQIHAHRDKFTKIYDEEGNEVNPIPDNVKVTVWCNHPRYGGYACDVFKNQIGINLFIAESWILEDELQELCAPPLKKD